MKLSTLQRKKFRVRNKLKNNSKNDRFRLSISRSLKNISAQIIDDVNNKTILSASSYEKGIKSGKINKTDLSKIVAEKLAKKAGEKGPRGSPETTRWRARWPSWRRWRSSAPPTPRPPCTSRRGRIPSIVP